MNPFPTSNSFPNVPFVSVKHELTNNGTRVRLTFAPLTAGSYQIAINSAAVTDSVGNALGAANIVTPFNVQLGLATWSNSQGGRWDDPNNWDAGHVPGAPVGQICYFGAG